MVKKGRNNFLFFFYKKFFIFSFLYLNCNKFCITYKTIYSSLNILKFLSLNSNFGIFLPTYFKINSSIFYSFWIDGFISNFKVIRWFFIEIFNLKYLPVILFNFTEVFSITLEIKNKQLPLINLTSFNFNYLYSDYSFKGLFNKEKKTNQYDNIYFFIFIFKHLKYYKKI